MVIDNPPLSHPSRGAWIEIGQHQDTARQPESHPSRGAWIEIVLSHKNSTRSASRTPHGVRGLKSHVSRVGHHGASSHPSRGAWIEIFRVSRSWGQWCVAPLTGCVD